MIHLKWVVLNIGIIIKKKYNKNNGNPYLKNQLGNKDALFCRQNKNKITLKVEKDFN